MPLQKLQLAPGINRSSTDYAGEGGYYACDKVRFRNGMPEKIGGWVKYTNNTLPDSIRALFNWVTVDGKNLMAVGTPNKYYIEYSGVYYDITPVRTSVTLPDGSLNTTNGSTTIRVTHTAHGAKTGDTVIVSGAADVNGITAFYINREFVIIVVDADTYTIGTETPATSSGSGGGAAVLVKLLLSQGVDRAVTGKGWNAGRWGRGAWGSAATVAQVETMRVWSQDSFGEDLVFCTRDGKIYYWDYSDGFTTRAISLTEIENASDVPLMASRLILSPADRHLFALGTNAIGASIIDPLLIRWCSQENLAEWSPSAINSAGELRLSSGNKIVAAVRLRQDILVFTDCSIHAVQLIGAPYIFGAQSVADNISIVSANAVVTVGNAVMWMGNDKFYMFGGAVQSIPCTLIDYVFDDINLKQADKFFAGTNEGFSEVWWFYCSANSNEVDRYVIYNYDEQVWAYGSMERSAWLDSASKTGPVAAKAGQLYLHETGVDDDRSAPIHAWVESSDFDIGDGERFQFVKRLLPDVTFTGSIVSNPACKITLTPRRSAGSAYKTGDSNTVTRSASVTVEQFTERCPVRLRGRQLKFRIESDELGVHWRMGVPRIDVQLDGGK